MLGNEVINRMGSGTLLRVQVYEHTVEQLRAASEVEEAMLVVALEGLHSLQGSGPAAGGRGG